MGKIQITSLQSDLLNLIEEYNLTLVEELKNLGHFRYTSNLSIYVKVISDLYKIMNKYDPQVHSKLVGNKMEEDKNEN